ncbi:TIGR00725 family protein [Fulvivirgaceae bacterium PWU4]|uniref:TIGR00725 family protein n=1 Tax=Chryseosolibacter histidini TaxID=2782349 RepID=A0AAP2DN98_9BACT|nr:TIGR00725 family protein [Chryseosolibacter histidini]MBT1699431.1 TIGR00725 family protein [Chryseosolibacter histidini]
MARKTIVGIMGPGENATPEDNEIAFELGKAVAEHGWVILTGGRSFGVMDAAMKGAHEGNGLTIGVLPNDNSVNSSDNADIKILTGMGSARNMINVLSSHVIVVIGMAAGTASEVALALKSNKKVILLNQDEITIRFFKNIGTYKVMVSSSVSETIAMIKDYLSVYHVY